MNATEQLPSELLTEVFSYLPASDLINCARVCPQWSDVARQLHLWSVLYRKIRPSILWLDRYMVRNINLSGVEDQEEVGKLKWRDSQSRAKQLEQLFLRADFGTSRTNQSVCWSPTNPSNADHQCTMFGPAIDQPEFSEAFFRSLLRWVDVETCGRFLSENVPIRGSTNAGWAGLGLPLRLPSSRNGEAFRLVILHARDKATRASLPFGGHRVAGSSLVTSDIVRAPYGVSLTPEAASTISQSNSVVYTVDLRGPGDATYVNQTEKEDRWDQMRLELNAVTSVMSDRQKLVILGLQRTSDLLGERIGPYTVAKQLGTGFTRNDSTVEPLSNDRVNWRVWCTSADEVNSDHLEQIFTWLTQEQTVSK